MSLYVKLDSVLCEMIFFHVFVTAYIIIRVYPQSNEIHNTGLKFLLHCQNSVIIFFLYINYAVYTLVIIYMCVHVYRMLKLRISM